MGTVSIKMFTRGRIKLERMVTGDTFKLCGKDDCYQVIDLTKVDGFTEPGPVLRKDVVYCTDVVTGIVNVFPNNLEVEIVLLDVVEVLNRVATP